MLHNFAFQSILHNFVFNLALILHNFGALGMGLCVCVSVLSVCVCARVVGGGIAIGR